MVLRITCRTILKAFWGGFLLLTAVYCLLAFLPYTYSSLIKAPPYDWIPWFVLHYPALYWLGLAAALGAYWPIHKEKSKLILFSVQVGLGIYISIRPVLPSLHSDWRAYICCLAALGLLIPVAAIHTVQSITARSRSAETLRLFDYSTAMFVAAAVALLWAGAAQFHLYSETHSLKFGSGALELTAWSVLSHALVAVLILSILNLILVAASKTASPILIRHALTGLFVFCILWFVTIRFLENGMSFDGWAAQLFASSFSAALTLLGFSLILPFLQRNTRRPSSPSATRDRLLALSIALGFGAFIVALPGIIQGGDWNGVIEHTVALAGWFVLGICAYRVRTPKAKYSVAAILGVALLWGVGYKTLQATEIFWGKPLGNTDDDVARAEEGYAVRDASFDLANDALGNGRYQDCGDLCHILRQYTNLNFESQTEVRLVDPLVPTQGERPNIFIVVMDSMRPDYLGAYNPKADFSPNLDAFARDSIVIHNAYTQYAGTSLSEPAIWAGTMLLHDHDFTNFPKVNSLEKLAKVDGYQMIVSYDTFLRQMLSPSDDLVKLDADKLWNQVEVCSTVQQTEQALDSNANLSRPVFFYSQPMNVHQFAHNNLPRLTAANWQSRPGFNTRITYEIHQVDGCLGGFFAYLKRRNLYDNSIIILTADHGDATGEYGRFSHSLTIYPEIMRVPLIVHLPKKMRDELVYDDSRISTLTDIAPSLYYLLGHRPIIANPLFGHPLFMENQAGLHSYSRDELFLASDERAVYGILANNGRYLYATYDSPAKSYLYDLTTDPTGLHDVLTPALKKEYDERIIQYLRSIGDFYGYKPKLGTLLAASEN